MFLVLLISSTFSMLDLVNFPHDFMIKKFYQVFQRDIRELYNESKHGLEMDFKENFYFAYVSDNLQHFSKFDLFDLHFRSRS